MKVECDVLEELDMPGLEDAIKRLVRVGIMQGLDDRIGLLILCLSAVDPQNAVFRDRNRRSVKRKRLNDRSNRLLNQRLRLGVRVKLSGELGALVELAIASSRGTILMAALAVNIQLSP